MIANVQPKYGHYFKDVSHLKKIDVYRVIDLWEITDPALQHALKKVLAAGKRGAKNQLQDVAEAIDSLVRFQDMQAENNQKELRMSSQTIEQEIQAKGKTAPRITPADVEANIASEHYFTAYGGAKYGRITRDEPQDSEALKLLTFCVLVLRNGFTVTGESACASPENFDAEIGRKIARENAINKIWPLMGYELRTKLANK